MKIEQIPIEKLIKDPANARKHNQKNIEAIKGSLLKFGQQKPIVINDKNIVIAGNGTLEAARLLGWKDISVVVTNLKGSELSAFGIADNRTAELAEWDDTALEIILKQLKEDGFNVAEIGFDESFLEEKEENYTRKIEAPIYKPKRDKPKIAELFDKEKADKLSEKILKSSLPEEEKSFLLEAAKRHVVFNFENIAEYYAHASKEAQELMEESALIIIDFDKAIENGFIKFTEEIQEQYIKEYADEIE